MAVAIPTPKVKLYDLMEGLVTGGEKCWTAAFRGRTLDQELALLKAGTLNDWVQTVDQDFDPFTDDVVANSAVAVTPATGHGPWMAKGLQTLQQGIWEHRGIDDINYPDMYFQAAPSVLGMKMRRWSGVTDTGSNKRAVTAAMAMGRLSLANGNVDCKLEPVISFAQQYGFFEVRKKSPNPNSPQEFNGVLWSAAPWWYTLNQFGGTPGNVFTSRGEPDGNEDYQDSRGGESASIHCSFHKHESLRLNQPDEWGRDISDVSNIISMTNAANWAIFGTDANYRLHNSFHDLGALMTPEWFICYFNRIEMGRFEMFHEMQQKLVPMLTSAVQVNDVPAGQTTPFDVDYVLEVDWYRVWQNPDWHRSDLSPVTNEPKAMGGTANAKTYTTTLPMASYAAGDGFVFVAKANSTNTTTSVTMAANGLAALPVVKEGPETNTPLTTYVRSTTFEPLAVGDITLGEYYAYKIDNANSRIIQLDKGRTMKHPAQYAPPAYTEPLADLDVRAAEATIAQRFRIGDLFPTDLARPVPDLFPEQTYPHPAREFPFNKFLIPAWMPPDVYITTVEQTAADTVIGRVDPDSAPPRVRRMMETNTYFDISPGNGNVFVKAPPPIGLYEVIVHGWSIPPCPNVKGGNRTRVHINIVADVPFDLSFFGANRILEMDATNAGSMTLVGSKVSVWNSLATPARIATQATDADRPVYEAAGLNGRPCLTSTGLPIIMNLSDRIGFSGGTFNLDVLLSETRLTMEATTATGDAYNFTVPHILFWEWNPTDGAKCFVNGVDIGLANTTGVSFINNGWAIAVFSAQVAVGGRGLVFSQNNTVSDLFASRTTSGTSFKGKLGLLAFGKGAQTTEGRDKLHGYAAWKFWDDAAEILPDDHPYVGAAPRMIG